MTLDFDPSTDFEDVTDGLEAVTLDRRGKASTSVTNALRRRIATTEVSASDGMYMAGDTRWHFPVVECTTPPALGDVIVDGDADRWTVIDVTKCTLSKRWNCAGRELSIAYGLYDRLTIEEAVYSKGTGGAAEQTWRTWKTGIKCRIQESSADVSMAQDAYHMAKRYEIVIANDVAINHTHRIKGANGTLYKIEERRGAQEIDGLQTIVASEWQLA